MRTALTLALGALAVVPVGASADVRTVRFGGELGNRYEPAELTVQAGDVVEWTGDFAVHPLRYRPSPSEPYSAPYTGPAPLRRTLSAVGDQLEYVCAIHGDAGMRGVVSAVAAGDPRPLTRPPLLSLRTEPREPVAGRRVTFIVSYVEGSGEGRFTQFAWDLDGDGRVRPKDGPDRITKTPRVSTTFERAGKRKIAVTGSTTEPGAAGTSTTTFRFVVAAKADSTPPRLTVAGLTPTALPAILRSGLSVTLRAGEPVRARIDILHDGRVLARTTRRLGTKATAVKLRFSRASIDSLRKRKSVRLKLRVVARDDAGNRTTLRKTIIAR